jgi:hypothetical protein
MIRKGCLLLMLTLVGPGCLSSGAHVTKEAQQAPPVQMTTAPPSPPPPPAVTADQVNESNVPDVIQALTREMDYDATIRQSAVPPATTMEHAMNP